MKNQAANLVLAIIVLVTAYFLKLHYSMAGSEELIWILHPTTWLVEFLDQNKFHHVYGEGFVRTDNRYVIAPACAGVNYLITLFCMSGFFVLQTKSALTTRIRYLIFCLAGSYCLTLLVNALRIKISIVLFSAQFEWGWLNPDRLHRLAGICVYLIFLLIVYFLLKKMVRSPVQQRINASPLLRMWDRITYYDVSPFFWYLLIAVGVPFINNGWLNGGLLFIEHSLTVFTVTLVVLVICFLLKSNRCN